MKRIFITGVGGYLGCIVAQKLLEYGHVVVGTGRHDIRPVGVPDGVTYYPADICDSRRLSEIFRQENIEVVLHFAGMKEVGACKNEPEKCFLVNVGGTASVLEAMKTARVPHLLYLSTWAVYQVLPGSMVLREDGAIAPTTVYGLSKQMGEEMITTCYDVGSLPQFHIFRLGNVIGRGLLEGQRQGSFLDIVTEKLENNKKITLSGNDHDTMDGTVARDFIDVRDVAESCCAVVQHSESGLYNIGSGKPTTLKQLVDLVAEKTGKKSDIEIGPSRDGDPASVQLDVSQATHDFGWSPQFSLTDTINDSISQK